MESELFNIFDDNRNPIGVATRAEIHRIGHWHEAFHCWFVSREGEREYLYLQQRSAGKKDYPNLLDITAAGHILAHETVADGVREIREEIGIEVSLDELIPLGILEYRVTRPGFIDRELAHVYLHIGDNILGEAILQIEEVSGLVRTEFHSFCQLWRGETDRIRVEGFEMKGDHRVPIDRWVSKDRFVPHELSYYENVIQSVCEKWYK